MGSQRVSDKPALLVPLVPLVPLEPLVPRRKTGNYIISQLWIGYLVAKTRGSAGGLLFIQIPEFHPVSRSLCLQNRR